MTDPPICVQIPLYAYRPASRAKLDQIFQLKYNYQTSRVWKPMTPVPHLFQQLLPRCHFLRVTVFDSDIFFALLQIVF